MAEAPKIAYEGIYFAVDKAAVLEYDGWKTDFNTQTWGTTMEADRGVQNECIYFPGSQNCIITEAYNPLSTTTIAGSQQTIPGVQWLVYGGTDSNNWYRYW